MTRLSRPVDRELDTLVPDWSGRERGRVMVVRIAREGIYLRAKGCRAAGALLLPWASAWGRAMQIRMRDAALEKAKKALAKKRMNRK